MNSLFRTIAIATFCLLSVLTAEANTAKRDSIIVTFGEKTRLIIYGEDRKELEKLMSYDLNRLLKDLGARLDTMSGDNKIFYDDIDAKKYLKDSSKVDKDKNYVKISLKGIRIKDGETEVSITTRGIDIKDGDERVQMGKKDDMYEEDSTDSDDDEITTIHRVRKYKSPRQGFNISLGLNAYGNNNPQGYDTEIYDLRPFGSRYIALSMIKSATVVRGKNAGLHVDFGFDVAWNNLMFEGSNTVVKGGSDLEFPPFLNTEGRPVDLSKSKLTVPYFNISVMPTISFPKAVISHISAGMYAGYRLGGYTKTKLGTDGKKDHIRGDYYLNDFRYGAGFELGIRNFVDFFVQYDMNTLFQDNRGPAVRMINFGIRL